MNGVPAPLNLTVVAAHARNRVIGKGRAMPWHLSADLKRFRRITTGKPVVMGRRTFETLARPLPERRNVVLSRDPAFTAPGCEVASGLDALHQLVGAEECMVIGGGEVYRQCLPLCRRIHLTLVQAEPEGDVFFPRLDEAEWRRTEVGEHAADERNDYDVVFVELVRRGSSR